MRILLVEDNQMLAEGVVYVLRDYGHEVSVVGLGCNQFGGRLDESETAAVVDAALKSVIASPV